MDTDPSRYYTLKTGTPVEDGDPILKLLWGVSCPEIQLGVGIHSELDDKQITYILSEDQVSILVHYKFFRV